MKPKIERNVEVPNTRRKYGRGQLRFPELAELKYDKETGLGDCAIYPNTVQNRSELVYKAKGRYNRAQSGIFAGFEFAHRFEERDGKDVIVIYRVK